MIKELSIRTIKNRHYFVSECRVLDTDENKEYFVVSQFGDLLYATFESSYIDYVTGKSNEEPIKVEGMNYWWWQDSDRFGAQYWKTYNEVSSLRNRYYLTRKYAHMKKPLGNIEYEIVSKKQEDVHACGPCGAIYEIEFLLKKDNKHLFVYSNDLVGGYLLLDQSVFKADELGECVVPIEELSCFANAKKSQYYDLYLEMEKYKDNY